MQGRDPKSLIQIARAGGEDAPAEPLDLGVRVRELRKARDWTLEQAANQAGLARSTLSKIENICLLSHLASLKGRLRGVFFGHFRVGFDDFLSHFFEVLFERLSGSLGGTPSNHRNSGFA